jgi:hypothetical protein
LIPNRSLASLLLLLPAITYSAPQKPWKIFLLFGQSNMHGGSTSDAEDRKTNPRVKVLAYDNCSTTGRTYNQWAIAAPALHSCGTGVGLGDWFGKVVADSLRSDTIALIPCAVAGVDISFFSKGVVSSRRKDFSIPPDNHWTGAYPWMLERLKLAKEKGEIAGILFHQGEADWSDTARKVWVSRVAKIVKDLKVDAGFGDVPFLAGELRQRLNKTTNESCCYAHNPYVAALAQSVPNARVISSAGLDPANDAYHLTSLGNREFGKRYAAAMLDALAKSSGSSGKRPSNSVEWNLVRGSNGASIEFLEEQDHIELRSLEGRVLALGAGRKLAMPAGGGLVLMTASGRAGRISGMVPISP